MLSKEESAVMHHYLKGGFSKTAVAKKLGISRRTGHRYVSEGRESPEYRARPCFVIMRRQSEGFAPRGVL
jgi:transposase